MTAEQTPVVSIVIPCFNYAHYLPQAIESVLAQTYRNREVFVIDDGSEDNTAEVAARFGNGLHYVYKPNRGLSHTRNYGAQLCSGRYIVFLDADDLLAPTFVEECVEKISSQPDASFVYTQVHHFEGTDFVTTLPEFDPERLKQGNYIDACSLLKRDLVLQFPYDESNRIGWEDWDFYLTLLEHGHLGVLLNKPLLRRRCHAGSMVTKIDPIMKKRLWLYVMRRHKKLIGNKKFYVNRWRFFRLQLRLFLRRLRPKTNVA